MRQTVVKQFLEDSHILKYPQWIYYLHPGFQLLMNYKSLDWGFPNLCFSLSNILSVSYFVNMLVCLDFSVLLFRFFAAFLMYTHRLTPNTLAAISQHHLLLHIKAC